VQDNLILSGLSKWRADEEFGECESIPIHRNVPSATPRCGPAPHKTRARISSNQPRANASRSAHLAHVAGPAFWLQNDLSHGVGLHLAILRGDDDSAPVNTG
jgi:hypothetical protein